LPATRKQRLPQLDLQRRSQRLPPAVKATRAERKAEKKQIEANEKMALAECKKLKGDEKKACKKQAEEQEKTATAALKAK
jgi:hypothetical protein